MEFGINVIDYFIKKFSDETLWTNLLDITVRIIIIVTIAGIVVKIAKNVIKKVFNLRAKSPLRISERRDATMLKLLQNIVAYFVYFIAFTNYIRN